MNFKLLKDINPNWSFSKLRLDVRREHTDLSTPCELGINTKAMNGKTIRKKLMLHLGLTKELIKGMHCCHLCACDSKNGGCQNVAHVYFGSPQENRFDTTYGHFNHSDAIAGALGPINEPYCPDCGFTSGAEHPFQRRAKVKRHIRTKACNSINSPIKTQTHPSFAAKEEKV